jgi:hypothetical protein
MRVHSTPLRELCDDHSTPLRCCATMRVYSTPLRECVTMRVHSTPLRGAVCVFRVYGKRGHSAHHSAPQLRRCTVKCVVALCLVGGLPVVRPRTVSGAASISRALEMARNHSVLGRCSCLGVCRLLPLFRSCLTLLVFWYKSCLSAASYCSCLGRSIVHAVCHCCSCIGRVGFVYELSVFVSVLVEKLLLFLLIICPCWCCIPADGRIWSRAI